jgi:hypothetical protein
VDVGERESGELRDLRACQVCAVAEREDLAVPICEVGERFRERGLQTEVRPVAVDARQRLRVCVLQGNVRRVWGPCAVVVDQQVARDREQPRADCGAARVEAVPRPQRPLEALLRQVLGVVPVVQPVGEKAVDAREVVVVCLFEVQGDVGYRGETRLP